MRAVPLRVCTVLVYLNSVEEGGGGGTLFRRLNVEVRPCKGTALIFFPGFLNGDIDQDALHAAMPPKGATKWVSQVWIRQSFREDGEASSPVGREAQVLTGPLPEGVYAGYCLAGDDIREAVMPFAQAEEWARSHEKCVGFTYKDPSRRPEGPVRVWFKSRLKVLHHSEWWAYSCGRGIA